MLPNCEPPVLEATNDPWSTDLLEAAGWTAVQLERLAKVKFQVLSGARDELTMEFKRLEFAHYYYFMRSRVVFDKES